MRLAVEKTYKLYVGGKFIRSESGRVLRVKARGGSSINVCSASRKDFRDAMELARKAQAGWAARTGYNRGQILYRLAEMLEGRRETLPTDAADASRAIDRAVHHAGWSDKISALLSSLNPVASAHVNYSMLRPVGVVVAAPAAEDGLTGMVEALCAATVMGDAVQLFVPVALAELAAALIESLATCDMPGGVVNVMTADVPALLSWASRHDDLDCVYLARGALDREALAELEREAARVMRRVVIVESAQEPATPQTLERLAEVKTVWMSS